MRTFGRCTHWLSAASSALTVALVVRSVFACGDGIDPLGEDQAIQNSHPCSEGFVNAALVSWDFNDEWGGGYGGGDPRFRCSTMERPFQRAMVSLRLMVYGMPDVSARRYGDTSYHGRKDYAPLTQSFDDQWHDNFFYKPVESTDVLGNNPRFTPDIPEHRIELYCSLFNFYTPANAKNNDSDFNFPTMRAAVMVHESWHGWEEEQDVTYPCSGHRCGPQGDCSQGTCDIWTYHDPGAFEYGNLYAIAPRTRPHHSPFQIEIEYLCDLATFPTDWVSPTTVNTAQSEAQAIVNEFIINPVPVVCGKPTNYRETFITSTPVRTTPPNAPQCKFTVNCQGQVSAIDCVGIHTQLGDQPSLQELEQTFGLPEFKTVEIAGKIDDPNFIFTGLGAPDPIHHETTFRVCVTNTAGTTCGDPVTVQPAAPCTCKLRNEACTVDSDCCPETGACLNGFCGVRIN